MSLDAMKQALEALNDCTYDEEGYCLNPDNVDAILALRAAIEQAQDPETELEAYKRLYELRGKALERPCSNCGHQPAKIKAMAQPEQKPVAWCIVENGRVHGLVKTKPAVMNAEKWQPLYTAPRQWQGLTNEEIKIIWRDIDGSEGMLMRFARAIEAKLKEKNT